ncbi:DUF2277 family protein [Pseudobacteriovorax antillogorgiicola]|uniref:DUF2277 family protein n=1 Tax=Pseudobacteriovorax antillogorgiicola TaxID=1513793 RepID=UPI0010457B43
MCRNIKKLRRVKPVVRIDEVEQSARCLVSKISGYQKPSQANSRCFETCVQEVVSHTQNLLLSLKLNGVRLCVET